MPDLLSRWRRPPPPGGRGGQAPPGSPQLAVLRLLAAELGDTERQIDEAFERTRLPEKLLRTRTWDRNRAELEATPGMEGLCADLESAYTDIRRINQLRTARMWRQYLLLAGDRVEDSLARIRHALDALEITIEKLNPPRL
ncbi:MAG: hypothetical protein WB802_12080 [Candidatus Dormiibacterota bacterium]|jgi:hypothetical protein